MSYRNRSRKPEKQPSKLQLATTDLTNDLKHQFSQLLPSLPWQPETENEEDYASTRDVRKAASEDEQHAAEPSFARATRQWHVEVTAPTKLMLGKYLLPTLRSPLASMGVLKQPKMIFLELYHVGSLTKAEGDEEEEDKVDAEQLQRHLRGGSLSSRYVPNMSTNTAKNDKEDTGLLNGEAALQDGEYILLRIFKPLKPKNEDQAAPRGKSEGTLKMSEANDSNKTEFQSSHEPVATKLVDPQTGITWVEQIMCDLDDAMIVQHKGAYVELRFGRGSDTQMRWVQFAQMEEATSFVQIVQKLGSLEAQRTQQRVQQYYQKLQEKTENPTASVTTRAKGGIQIVVEVVSAIHLPAADLLGWSGDPYVVVHLGAKEVHQTKIISNTLNPIWTVDSGALFLLETTPEEFFAASSGLTFVVKNYDPVKRHPMFGIAIITQEELLEGTGARMEFPIEFGDFEAKDGSTKSGKLYLRYRQAKRHDLEFLRRLQEFHQGGKLLQCAEAVVPRAVYKAGEAVAVVTKQLLTEAKPGVYFEETYVPVKVTNNVLLQGKRKKDLENLNGPDLVRVKPYPDPDRTEETKWLHMEDIEAETLKPSSNWTETGTGDLGKLFVEVLGCDGLPNMDAMPIIGDAIPAANVLTGGKTDAFVCMVFEDCIVNTDVINDSLAPRWLPWTQRSFVFHIYDPSSQLMVGVFDFDTPLPGAKHDAIGRVTVDISNFCPDTVYTLVYKLYTSDTSAKRTVQGQIKLRLKLELPDTRKVVLAALKRPPPFYINVATYRDYATARYTVEGEFDPTQYDIRTLTEHVDEIRDYENLIPVLKEVVLTVLLWRGHYPINIAGAEVLLPLHSISVFIVGVILSEHYNLLPSFILFGIAWLLYSTSGHLSDDPSPWKKPFTPLQLSKAIVAGGIGTAQIEPYQNKDAIERYEEQQEDFKKRLDEQAKKKEQEKEAVEALGKTCELVALNAAEEVKMAFKMEKKGISINPLEPYLFPLQQHLRQVCVVLRIARSFLTWQDPLPTFWICIICLVGGCVFVFVPWGFLIRWTIRILVWLLLGPWMKLVDIYYVRREVDAKEAEAAFIADKLRELHDTAESSQIKREEMLKLKHMKEYMFGKYLVELPRWKESRYVDVPLTASSATPFVPDETNKQSFKIIDRKYGQHISGSIIPEREIQKETEVEPFGTTDSKEKKQQ